MAHLRKPGLLTQVLVVNSVLIALALAAGAVAARLDLTDLTGLRQFLALGAAVLSTVLVNGLVLRRRLAPLERIIETMEHVDLARPGLRVGAERGDAAEVERLHRAFDRMLERLEAERAAAATAVLRGQEGERARLARDLHDEINQALTAVLLRLQATQHHAPPELGEELAATRQVAVQAMEELLRLSRELRPVMLDDLGLEAALRSMVERVGLEAGLRTHLRVDGALDDVPEEEQLVAYRVVQESLSNVTKHAHAGGVTVEVRRTGARLAVRVVDDGTGFDVAAADGLGLPGMRERALLAGGRLDVTSSPGRGTVVELEIAA